jgi:rfaE bifunctional protein kinase chain/domain
MKPIEDVKILVVGDIMLDKYVVGDVERISPEAPVPIVKVTNEFSTLGGCGNVVRNAREIGAQVNCISAVGRDRNANLIRKHLDEIGAGDWCFESSNGTTVKERIVANSRRTQMVRVDRENISPISFSYIHDKCLEIYFKKHVLPDIIIISDYAKGMISFDLMVYLKSLGVKIIVDPKPQNGNCYNGVFMITPNEKEWASMTLTSAYHLDNIKYTLVTLGKNGMELRDFNQHWKIPAEDIHMVYNVSGAGDTVVAIVSACIAMGINPVAAAKIANSCAGYVVTQPGTATVPKDYFKEALQKYGG